ncbi:MAG: hypothetical protein M3352_12330 [Bacteroidota bacterium]|nr:hypothetical protein [Bacteroidota bacterium]
MTIYQFLAADEEQQIQAFWDGTFIGEREEDGYTIICHQVILKSLQIQTLLYL